ncbi:MAG: hypothetical protein M3Y76_07910, partial [Chloroflexota bacterium]|nr:hypothetical protein [Chloroflexota bacterium]
MNKLLDSKVGNKEKRIRLRIEWATSATALFSRWSMRRHVGQFLPVSVAFLLLVGSVQAIGTFHDISSALTQQKIAQNWRGPYDLLVRPQSSVSQPEQSANWIDPQSVLENYGGVSAQQVASIRSLSEVTQLAPFANLGWQSISVQLSLELAPMGIYRITATWQGGDLAGGDIVRYVDVTNLTRLTTGIPALLPPLVHVIAKNASSPVVFALPIQATQQVIGVPAEQQQLLAKVLLEGVAPTAAVHFVVHISKLRRNIDMLPACLQRADCWQLQPVRQGATRYQVDGVQLLRYSHINFNVTPQQLAAGQISVLPLGRDMQGPLYRIQLATRDTPTAIGNVGERAYSEPLSSPIMPVFEPMRLAVLPGAVRFIPLEQACSMSGSNCYSGLYVRLQGVEQYSQRSLAVLQATAATITARTGLHVDILDGSSSRSIGIVSASSNDGRIVRTSWTVVGVAVQLIQGVDTLQKLLLVLCSFVCLLAIGAAALLVGSGRRKEASLLRQLGWQSNLVLSVFLLDALFLCLPGCALVFTFMIIAATILHSHIPPSVVVFLLSCGVIVYCCTLVSSACFDLKQRKKKRIHRPHPPQGENKPIRRGDLDGRPPHPPQGENKPTRRSAIHWRPPAIACILAITTAVFLIATNTTLISSFNHELVITVLGRQVREVLEAPQIAFLLFIVLAALLTVELCT